MSIGTPITVVSMDMGSSALYSTRASISAVSTTNAPPAPGRFEGNVTVKMDLR